MIETIPLLLILIVELEIAGSGRILEEQPGPGVIGIDLEDPLVALLGVDEVVAVLIEDAEVHQRPDRRWIPLHGPLVAGLGLVVVADPVVDHSHREQSGGMPRIEGERLLQRDHRVGQREAEIGRNRCLLGPEISGGFRGRAEFGKGRLGLFRMAGKTLRLGYSHGAGGEIVAPFLGGRERFSGAREEVGGVIARHRQREERPSLVVVGDRATVCRLQGLDRVLPATEEVLPHTETDARCRTPLLLPVELLDGPAEISVGGRITAEKPDQTGDFVRAERAGAGEQIADVDGGGHIGLSAEEGKKASGGSRTRNPRITNAVLCQLKLRWPVVLPGSDRRDPPRGQIAAVPTRMPRALRPTGAPAKRSAQGDSRPSEPRKLAQGPGHRQGSYGKMAATGYSARRRWMPGRPDRTIRSRVQHTGENRRFSTRPRMALWTWSQPKKKGGASDPAGASCHGSAGQGQGDRTPGVSQRPHLMCGLCRAVGAVRRESRVADGVPKLAAASNFDSMGSRNG